MRDQFMPDSTLLFDGTSIFITKNIYCVDTGDKQGFKASAIQKKTKNVLDTLGVDLLRKI